MGQVKIINDNIHPHKELFRGDMIDIEPGGFVIMDEDDARLFRGQAIPIKKDAQEVQDPRSYKILRVVPLEDAAPQAPEPAKFISQIDGKEFSSQAELDKHLEQFKDRVFKDEVLDEELKRKQKR